ncbi:MAG TPA: hypothetical protein VF322_01600 [Gammaproteobacteria bacterium]
MAGNVAIHPDGAVHRAARGAWLGAALLLAACGGGPDGSVGLGSGQEPDPVAPDFPIFYTKGPLFDEDMQLQTSTDIREVLRFNVGTDLYMRDRASPSAPEHNVTFGETQGMGDVMGVEVSPDGTKVVFAMRGPFDPNLDDEDQPTWNIWEYEIATDTLRRVIASDIVAEAGHDVAPHYLPDGRIIFSSTRQRQSKAILLDEGKPQFDALDEDRNEPALVLHVMNADGSDLHQVSFNQSHDLDPTVLDSGKVMFSRWDHAGNVNGIHLYRMNPDGTELELLYGAESHMTGTDGGQVQFVGAREMPDGRIMAIARPFDHPELGGDIVIIDAATYVENTQPTQANAGMTGPAQTSATPNQVRTDLAPSPGGRFSSAFPLWDGTGRVLVSWAICRLLQDDPDNPGEQIVAPCTEEALADPAAEIAPPLYGVWMYDPSTETQLPIVVGEEGVLIGDAVAAQPRPNPQHIPDLLPDSELAQENVGILNIRSVYDVDGVATADIAALADPLRTTAADRPARFLRVVKAVSIPDEDVADLDNTAFGPNIRNGMREIVGYAPIEPDGSVRIKVPANVPLAVEVLDANGRRISPRHQNWIQVRPGEELECNGCHSPQSGLSHGRRDSFAPAYDGAQNTGVPFPNTVAAFSPDFGDTMAETRTRASCQTNNCAALEPSVNLVYEDVWTDPMVRTPDAAFAYTYDTLPAIPARPTSCMTDWTAGCRIVIHYEQHIHPLWSLPRLDANGVDRTCTNGGCHAPVDAMGAPAVPAAQLDLTDGPSLDEAAHFNAYRELLFADNEQELVNGVLQDRQVQVGTDEDGNPILAPVSIPPPMSSAGANASSRFFAPFVPGGTHAGFLTPNELRLISEWLDLGAQYYNDPFDVPVM